jgi:hypothetical protein
MSPLFYIGSHETFKEANLADSSMAREDASFLTTLHH